MRIGILMSNTDDSEFSRSHPKDGDKWRDLLAPLCPECEFPVYSVKDGHFPEHVTGHDGFIITGSPASVHDLDAWLPKLFGLIREATDAGVPLFGACFGHQAIALALGGKVAFNPGGWVIGSTVTDVADPAPWMEAGPLRQYAAHIEQVVQLPEAAQVTMTNKDCPIGGFIVGDKIFTTQYHPEMTHDFICALVDELAGKIPADAMDAARASLDGTNDNPVFARWIVEFFHQVGA
ncbi:type 1 glutamine amidotransferase [Alisedimentitalea sp. MJ-SS2]|uniref:type 1 glutamine amidotransferase n=1 Tax=Aliisedimentitalea sp. MJ-SS2 TaxID=3049795 RepID=UPI002909BDBA|nr:type 1 glutamine amidotransferase [Alisedimentitalea sp. MJ-SS2]MDU8928000.1 type 1 glutamine amidotransferase [Alisedimentitalea sp. MJ-SS2]